MTHREQTSGYQWEEGWGRVNIQAGDKEVKITRYKTNIVLNYIKVSQNIKIELPSVQFSSVTQSCLTF